MPFKPKGNEVFFAVTTNEFVRRGIRESLIKLDLDAQIFTIEYKGKVLPAFRIPYILVEEIKKNQDALRFTNIYHQIGSDPIVEFQPPKIMKGVRTRMLKKTFRRTALMPR